MPCIHGLDDANCPTCRIIKSTVPKISPSFIEYNLNPENTLFKQRSLEKEEYLKDLAPSNAISNLNPINIVQKPNLLNELPNFENKMFLDRLKEIDIAKLDTFGISKKISLASRELKIDKEE